MSHDNHRTKTPPISRATAGKTVDSEHDSGTAVSAGDQETSGATPRHSYQMLPKQFTQQQSGHRVIEVWSAVVFLLLTLLAGVSSSCWSQGHQSRIQNANLIAQSEPICEVRKTCLRLEQENKVFGKWIQAVDAAKPDDSVLQVFLAIAESKTKSASEITIDEIDIKLSVEDPSKGSSPKRVEPGLTIKASLPVTANQVPPAKLSIDKMTDHLMTSGRTSDTHWNRVGEESGHVIVRITGQPIATRIVP